MHYNLLIWNLFPIMRQYLFYWPGCKRVIGRVICSPWGYRPGDHCLINSLHHGFLTLFAHVMNGLLWSSTRTLFIVEMASPIPAAKARSYHCCSESAGNGQMDRLLCWKDPSIICWPLLPSFISRRVIRFHFQSTSLVCQDAETNFARSKRSFNYEHFKLLALSLLHEYMISRSELLFLVDGPESRIRL